MKRKLVLLNLVLVALIGAAAWRLRVEWVAWHERENRVLHRKLPAAVAPPHSPLAEAQPVRAATYEDIAQKDLLVKDRNPTIVVEPPPPPPPPKPMPALPVLRGVLSFPGEEPTVIMSENPKSMAREVRIGDSLGEFKLLAANNREIVLEWEGKEVRKKPEELMDHSAEPAAPAPAPAAGPSTGATNLTGARPLTVMSAPPGPGADVGKDGMKACVPGDSSPDGTVVSGMRKVMFNTPFGQGCRWDPVR